MSARRLLAPAPGSPARAAPGGLLALLVEVATGLTPPPGLQEDRAHRGFAIGLCARGLPLGAPELSCFPLVVRNVRPLDAGSLRYRIETPLPLWVAPGVYDLALRFPGGQVELPAGVELAAQPGDVRAANQPSQARAEPLGDGFRVAAPPDRPAQARLHVGAQGLALGGGRFQAYPLPDPVRGLRTGFVALFALAAGEQVVVQPGGARPALALRIEAPRAEAGRPVTLRARSDQARVFWWLDAERGALGRNVSARYVLRGRAPIEALALSPDGRVRRVQAELEVLPRRAFGCGLGPARFDSDVAGLLALAVSWKLASARRLRRRSLPGNRTGRRPVGGGR